MEIVVQFILIVASIQYFTYGRISLNQARNTRDNLVHKFIKTLKKEEGAIRLTGGTTNSEGNVEIFHNQQWGAICDDEWDRSEGEVVCKQLGFFGFKKVTHSSAFGLAKRKFWMDNIYCTGSESQLAQCRFQNWGENDCDASEAAGVICKDVSDFNRTSDIKVFRKYKIHKKHTMRTRLVGGRFPSEGQIEVSLDNGTWGSICADNWSLLEANVVCRELGLGFASSAIHSGYFKDIKDSPRIILSGTECNGNETSLLMCLHHNPNGIVHCYGSKDHVAAVTCTEHLPDLALDYTELEQSAHLEDKALFYLQCAMEENCVADEAYEIVKSNSAWHLETRRLLKFTIRVINIGTTDFRPSIPKHLWEWHMCHMHYHSMEVFAIYEIFDSNNLKVAQGHKASFCLEDNECFPEVTPKYACVNYGDQGISVNCSDIYRFNIDCQWVDITEMNFGDYKLKISVNPELKVAEMKFDNNAAVCKLTYTQQYARISDCIMGRP